MSHFKPRYVSPEIEKTPDQIAEEKRQSEITREQYKAGVETRAAIYAKMVADADADAEAERLEAERLAKAALNVQPTPANTIDISKGLSVLNGVVVPQQSIPPSQAVIKTKQLTEFNERTRQNVRR